MINGTTNVKTERHIAISIVGVVDNDDGGVDDCDAENDSTSDEFQLTFLFYYVFAFWKITKSWNMKISRSPSCLKLFRIHQTKSEQRLAYQGEAELQEVSQDKWGWFLKKNAGYKF